MNDWRIDPRLYLILGAAQCPQHDPVSLVTQAVKGGVSLVQLREKQLATREFLALARRLQQALAPLAVPLLINDRIDIALAAGTAGVHLGQQDMPVADARRLLGREAIIGLTVRSLDEAEAAPLELLDYLSIGGVFATRSKHNSEAPIGIRGLREIAQRLRVATELPLTAIAGIAPANAAEVIAAGVDGIAVISAICAARQPTRAAAELNAIVERALAARRNPA